MPDIVLPDTEDARNDSTKFYDLVVEYCEEYEFDDQLGNNPMRGQCKNRNPWGEHNHNWCFLCPAGYIYSQFEANPYSDTFEVMREITSW
jgi:hypothetical protein